MDDLSKIYSLIPDELRDKFRHFGSKYLAAVFSINFDIAPADHKFVQFSDTDALKIEARATRPDVRAAGLAIEVAGACVKVEKSRIYIKTDFAVCPQRVELLSGQRVNINFIVFIQIIDRHDIRFAAFQHAAEMSELLLFQ